MPDSREIVVSSRAADRIAAARAWLEALPNASEVLVIASIKEAADDLVRGFAVSRGAMLGMHRMTMNRLVGLLAAEHIADAGLAPADGLAAEAVAARAVFRLAPTNALAERVVRELERYFAEYDRIGTDANARTFSGSFFPSR